MSKEIPLTRGLVAIVDDGDYEQLVKARWCAHRGRNCWYARSTRRKGRLLMHHAILGIGARQQVDHANGDGLDNRRANLRVATQVQNSGNARVHIDNGSGFKGIFFYTAAPRAKPWVAQICVNGQRQCLGYFANPRDAARAYDQAAIQQFGEFARTNASMGLL